MSAAAVLGILVYLFLLGGLVTLNSTFLTLALPIVVYLAGAMISRPPKTTYHVLRRVRPQRIRPGFPLHVEVEVSGSPGGAGILQVRDAFPAGLSLIKGKATALTWFKGEEGVRFEYEVSGRRGVYDFSTLELLWSDALALFTQRTFAPASGQVVVLPYAPKVKHVAIRPRQTQVYAGYIPSRVGGRGVEFYGVRSYQTGDALRHLNWRLNTRYAEAFFTNEYVRERVAEVWLVLDARLRSEIYRSESSLFEHSVTATAALAQAILSEGNRVGLLVYGGFLDWVYPGYGKVQNERITYTLARAQPGESLVFAQLEHLPTRLFPLHSQIILISPLQPEDASILIHLRARGYSLIVLSPDPIAFEAQEIHDEAGQWGLRLAMLERKLLFAKLRQAGVQVLDWDVSVSFEAGMHGVLMRLPPWHFLQGVRA